MSLFDPGEVGEGSGELLFSCDDEEAQYLAT
jgi:hypothetical protein